jgi:hypothetical protein
MIDTPLPIDAQTPSYVAFFGGYSNAMDRLYQTVTVPAGARSVRLSFYYMVLTAETTPVAYDVLEAYTYETGLDRTTVLTRFDDNTPVTTWTRFTTDLPASLAGQTFQLGFRVTTNSVYTTAFFIDSVSLDVIGCPP